MKNTTLITAFILILITYSFTIINAPLCRTCSSVGCYNLLAESLINGKPYLLIPIPKQLQNIPFPYDKNIIKENLNIKINDLSLYKNKFYLYFGITPALLLYIPNQIIFHSYLNDRFTLLFFSFGLVIFSFLFLKKFLSNHNIKTPNYFETLSVLLIGLGNISFSQISNISPHNIAILSANFCFLSGLFFLYNSLTTTYKHLNILLGSLLLGLATGSRFSFIISTFLIIIYFSSLLLKQKNQKHTLLPLTIPYFSLLTFLLYYNHVRFENYFDFGFKYLINKNMMQESAFSINCFIPNFYFYFLYPPIINSSFPFIHNPEAELPKILYTPDLLFNEFLIGLVFNTPVLLFLFFILYKYKKYLPKIEIFILFIPSIVNALILLFFRSAALRYAYDFINLLILLFLISFSYITGKELTKKKIYSVLFIILSLVSIYMSSLADRSLVLKKTGSRFKFISSQQQLPDSPISSHSFVSLDVTLLNANLFIYRCTCGDVAPRSSFA